MSQDNFSPWFTEARAQWEAAVQAWLVEVGRSLSLGKIKTIAIVKERPWSAVHRVTFGAGTSYFKACGEGGKHEPGLLLLMQKRATPNIPEVQAVESNHKWFLMADAGQPLPESLPGLEQAKIFGEVLSNYAELQIASLGWVKELLDFELPDRRVSRLPQLLTEALTDDALGFGRTSESLSRLRASVNQQLPILEQVCDDLGRSTYSAALDHGDLHRGNLMLGAVGGYRLCDWGDSSVTHPFCSVLVSLETVLFHIPKEARLRWALYLRDAYLEPWGAIAPRASLLADFERALWVAHVVRVLNMAHMFRAADEATLNRWRPLIVDRLEMWLQHHDIVNQDQAHWVQALSL